MTPKLLLQIANPSGNADVSRALEELGKAEIAMRHFNEHAERLALIQLIAVIVIFVIAGAYGAYFCYQNRNRR